MSDFKEYLDRKVDYIIKQSESINHGAMTDNEKRLHGLTIQVFSFAANAIFRLGEWDEIEEEHREFLHKKVLEFDKRFREHDSMEERLLGDNR